MDDLVKRLREHKMRDNEMPNHYVRRLLIDRIEAAAALEAKEVEIERLRGIVGDALAAWDDHNATGDMMQGWWVSDGRAALQAKE